MSRCTAVVLAAGKGSRMGSEVAKQYLPLMGKPVMAHSLETFEQSSVEEIVLVVTPGEEEYCRLQIVEKYGIRKVSAIVAGGRERYHSVYNGLKKAAGDYVMIHDSARAFLTVDLVERCRREVTACGACVVGVPVKDTMRVTDADGYAVATPPRSNMWSVQTPQCFSLPLILEAYGRLLSQGDDAAVTDDAMVLERMTDQKIKMIPGSYQNIKITTPEDMLFGEAILAAEKAGKNI